MRVNFSVTNQLATPSIHAAALANRPPAGQPGRLFVDTDNPSSGIYRDTGTVWENITGGAGAGNLQTVTDAGNTTDNNILLTYPDNTLANALVFYNDQLAQEEYLIEKRGTGITTNDSLAIQSRGNISPSTNPVGFLIDGANDIVKSFYTTSYSEVGLKLDFASQNYKFGNLDNVVYGNLEIYDYDTEDYLVSLRSKSLNYDADISIKLIPDEQIKLRVESISNPNVYSAVDFNTGANRLELKNNDLTTIIQAQSTEITNSLNDAGNSTSLALFTYLDFSNNTAIHKTQYNGNDYGLKLDFANDEYKFGNFFDTNKSYFYIDNPGNAYVKSEDGVSNLTIQSADLGGNDRGAQLLIQNSLLSTSLTLNTDPSSNLNQIYSQGTGEFKISNITNDSNLILQVAGGNSSIVTYKQTDEVGLKLDFANTSYLFGDFNNINGYSYILLNGLSQALQINTGGYENLYCASGTTRIGDTGANVNATEFGVDDVNETLTASANLLVGTSGPVSGQHLKVRIGGTDYVIELKDP